MNYRKDILNRLLDMYERRGAYDKDASILRSIQFDVRKAYPDYMDRYNHETYQEIHAAVDQLCDSGLITAKQNELGQYVKVKLNVDEVSVCYDEVNRISIPKQCERVRNVLLPYIGQAHPLLKKVIKDWIECLDQFRKLPYELKYDEIRVGNTISVLQSILRLDKETYIRNLSTALFKDSKRFQREFRNTVEAILFDYTEDVVEKRQILSFYNLYENPTYVMIKGNFNIHFDHSVIYGVEMPDGIALSNGSLENIRKIHIKAGKVITVENLTTYHDSDEEDAVHIYLGGYHNHAKQILLEKIYADNQHSSYYHKGDLDVYGFLILENLKEKTGIPFEPLRMDVKTLERFYQAGIYKSLTSSDKKMIEKNLHTKLEPYGDVLQYMLEHDCKVEQESFRAVELME